MTPEILAAVLAIIADTGYQLLRVEDVAARAGVSLGSVYRRWPTKQDLVVAALDSSPPPFAVEGTGDAEVDFVTVMTDLAGALSEPGHFRLALLAADPGEPGVSAAARRQIPHVRRHVRSLVADRVGPGHPALELLADAGPALVWYQALVAGGQVDTPELVRRLTAGVLDRMGYVPARSDPHDVAAGTPDTDRIRSPRRDRIHNRRSIIAAAGGLFRERAFSEVQLEDVALRAGVSRATLARHVGTKRQLLTAVRTERVRGVIQLAERASAETDPWRGVQMLFRSLAEWADEDRDLQDAIEGTGSGDGDEWRSLLQELLRSLDTVLDRARDAGLLRPDVSATDAFRLALAASSAVEARAADAFRYADILLRGFSRPRR